MQKNNIDKRQNKFLTFLLGLFQIKSLSIYQLSLGLLIFTSLISVILVSSLWGISETRRTHKLIADYKETILNNQKLKLKDEVKRVIYYLDYIKNDTLSRSIEEIKNNALNYFKNTRFGNDGYIFINTYDGKALLFDGQKLNIPRDIYEIEDPNGFKIFQKELELAKLPEGGYFQYLFKKIYGTEPKPKISYVVGYDEWGWIIGTGDYLDNIEANIASLQHDLKSDLYKKFFVVAGVFVIVLLLLTLTATGVAKMIHSQFSRFVFMLKQSPLNKNENQPFDRIFIRELKTIGFEILQAEELAKQFGNIIDQSINEIYIFNQQSLNFIHANRGAAKNCGYSLDELPALNIFSVQTLLNPRLFRDLVKPLIEKDVNQIRFETVHQRKDKSLYPVEVFLTKSTFYQKPVFVAFVYDISERLETMKELQNANKIINRSPVVAFRWRNEEDWPVDFVTDNVEVLLGYTAEEFKHNHITYSKTIHQEDIKRVEEEVAKHSKEEGRQSFTHKPYRIITKTGEIKWVDDITFILKDIQGDITHYEGIVYDISERKKAEENLQSKKQLLTNILESMSDAFVSLDRNWCYTYMNEKAGIIFGRDPKKIIGKNIWTEFPEGVGQPFQLQYEKAMNEKVFIQMEEYYPPLDKWFENRINPTEDGIAIFFQDITLSKKTEDELSKYRLHLEELVKEQTAELQETQKNLLNLVDDLNDQSTKLEESNTALSSINQELETFTYSVSHDLKAPLRGIDGYSQLLLDNYYNDLNEEAREFLTNIRQSTQQMNLLIEDLLAYSRMERQDFRTENVQVKGLVNNLLLYYSKTIDENKIGVKLNVPENFKLVCDKDGLNLVLRNLLDNAIKFTAQNNKAQIEIGCSETDSFWTIFVKDNGIGFDMKYHDRIFKIFQRLHLAEEYEGTGIGLAMVSKAALRMNAKLWAESEPGKGATFFLEILKSH